MVVAEVKCPFGGTIDPLDRALGDLLLRYEFETRDGAFYFLYCFVPSVSSLLRTLLGYQGMRKPDCVLSPR